MHSGVRANAAAAAASSVQAGVCKQPQALFFASAKHGIT
jgi:hypothetical protein